MKMEKVASCATGGERFQRESTVEAIVLEKASKKM